MTIIIYNKLNNKLEFYFLACVVTQFKKPISVADKQIITGSVFSRAVNDPDETQGAKVRLKLSLL